jgi:hypothetical protein
VCQVALDHSISSLFFALGTCSAQDLAPRAYLVTPLHSNAVTLTRTRRARPSTGAIRGQDEGRWTRPCSGSLTTPRPRSAGQRPRANGLRVVLQRSDCNRSRSCDAGEAGRSDSCRTVSLGGDLGEELIANPSENRWLFEKRVRGLIPSSGTPASSYD